MLAFKGASYAKPLAELHALCFAKPWTQENFLQILSLPTTIGYGNDKAFILCSDLTQDIEILTLAVLPSERRKGIATLLLKEIQNLVIKQNKNNIFLEVNATNIPAQQLYLKCGFIQTGKRKNYYHENGKTFDALCFTWKNPRHTVGD